MFVSGTVPYTEQTQIHLNTIKYTIIIIIIMAISYMIPQSPTLFGSLAGIIQLFGLLYALQSFHVL